MVGFNGNVQKCKKCGKTRNTRDLKYGICAHSCKTVKTAKKKCKCGAPSRANATYWQNLCEVCFENRKQKQVSDKRERHGDAVGR